MSASPPAWYVVPERAWQANKAAPACPACRKDFGARRWRHHCRACGRCVCDDCSKRRAAMRAAPESEKVVEKQRVCDLCVATQGVGDEQLFASEATAAAASPTTSTAVAHPAPIGRVQPHSSPPVPSQSRQRRGEDLCTLVLKYAFVLLVVLPICVAVVVAAFAGGLAGLLGASAAGVSWLSLGLLGPDASFLAKLLLFCVVLPVVSVIAVAIFVVVIQHVAPWLAYRTTSAVASEVVQHGLDGLIDSVCGTGTAATFETAELGQRPALAALAAAPATIERRLVGHKKDA